MSSSKSQSQKPSLNYGSPCAACKFLRRKCLPHCIFAPHFPADQPRKFDIVHRVYGASNISKILNHLSYDRRDEAVNSLVYEAEARLNEPVCGCVGFISTLQERLKQLQAELFVAQSELSTYTMLSKTQAARVPILQPLQYLPGVDSSSSSPVTRSMNEDTRRYLFEFDKFLMECPQQMTIDASQHRANQLINNAVCFDSTSFDSVQPHVVDRMSNVRRLHEQELHRQSFDNQQKKVEQQQPTTMLLPPQNNNINYTH